jgi:hypothetical protein
MRDTTGSYRCARVRGASGVLDVPTVPSAAGVDGCGAGYSGADGGWARAVARRCALAWFAGFATELVHDGGAGVVRMVTPSAAAPAPPPTISTVRAREALDAFPPTPLPMLVLRGRPIHSR